VLRQAQHGRVLGVHALICHPDTPSSDVASVSVELLSGSRHTLTLRYGVQPAGRLHLPEHHGGPTDGLWRSTCFELFVQIVGDVGYREFNFAPTNGWAAYAFSDYRSGMEPIRLDRHPTVLDDSRSPGYPSKYQFDVTVDRESWPRGTARIGLSAVIEEVGGTKSYWALRHPPGAPDFHHPDCFALELPALA